MPVLTDQHALDPAPTRRTSRAGVIALAAALVVLALLVGLLLPGAGAGAAGPQFGKIDSSYNSVLTHPGLTLRQRVEHILGGRPWGTAGSRRACIACHGR